MMFSEGVRQGEIYAKIIAAMGDIDAITKNRKNEKQRYMFRGIDDVYNSIHAVLAKHGIFTAPEVIAERSEDRVSGSGTPLIYRVLTIKYTFYAADGSNVSVTMIGEGMDSGDKASNKAQSVAHKYALLQVFAIPTAEEKDPEVDSHDVKAKPVERTAMNVRAELTLKARGQNVDEVKTWQASHGFPRDWEHMTVAEAEALLKDFCESFGV